MARIDDGFATKITFSSNASVKLYEKDVTPPGIDGGGEVETTTMRNTTYRTRNPKKLKTFSECNFTAAYDPTVYSQLIAMINVNQQITVTFPDAKTLVFWGWLNTFKPNGCKEGEQPTAECQIIPSNQNSAGTETAPTYPV